MSRVIELFEEVGHEVLQQSVLVVKLQERCLIGSDCLSGFKVSLVVNTRNYGELSLLPFRSLLPCGLPRPARNCHCCLIPLLDNFNDEYYY